jgi:UDP-N-acetyl-D-galactosamine dehydrogenase
MPHAIKNVSHIVVVGLGYVGLPLAVRLADVFTTSGIDIDSTRIEELRAGNDRTGEINSTILSKSTLFLADNPADCAAADLYIVTVPTPVDAANRPDLTLVRRATAMVARMIDPARVPIIVYESTVYPGVTEDVCGPIIEAVSGLQRGRDFVLGYSPERINPGDREHGIERIAKVVAGETPEITRRLCAIYDHVTGGTFPAASIAIAEAAKVIENAQRDINIAFVNEVAQIVGKLGLSVWDVLEAAGTKWNFLPFQPGLVGGHCIGVDPYYLSHCAEMAGHQPVVILAGRSINDSMAVWIADQLCADLAPGARILVLGLTFKENVPDLRNSKVADLIARCVALGHAVDVHDPLASPANAIHEHGIVLLPDMPVVAYDVVLLAVAHDAYRALAATQLAALVKPGGLFGDLKNIVPPHAAFDGVRRWRL